MPKNRAHLKIFGLKWKNYKIDGVMKYNSKNHATWPDGPLPSFVPMPHTGNFPHGKPAFIHPVPGVERLRSSNLLPKKLEVVQYVTCSDPAWGNCRSISKEREGKGHGLSSDDSADH